MSPRAGTLQRAAPIDTLERLRELISRRAREVRAAPVVYMRWLPLQWRFLSDRCRFKLIRAGNQTIGKTTPALAEVVGRCVGQHPAGVPVPPPPIEAWIVCAEWSQSLAIQEKLAALLPWDLVDRSVTRWTPEDGFAPLKSPVVKFLNGSIIRIKTTKQDAIAFAGAAIDVVMFDEPPRSTRMLTEAIKRLEDRGGVLILSMTPINAATEVLDHIRALCDRGVIADHWVELTPAELVPVGSTEPMRTADGRPKDAAWIASLGEAAVEAEIPIIVHGAWEGKRVDRFFGRFAASGVGAHVTEAMTTPAKLWVVAFGVDHGDRAGKQIAVLIWVDETDPTSPVFHIVDEYSDPTDDSSPAADARGVVAMLARRGLRWSDVDLAHGDRVHMPGSAQQKSNKDLYAQIRKLTRSDPKRGGIIETVKRGEGRRGSRSIGERFVYHAVNSGRLRVNPRCKRVIAAFLGYTGADDEHKDPIDAVRYALDPWIFGERGIRSAGHATVRLAS